MKIHRWALLPVLALALVATPVAAQDAAPADLLDRAQLAATGRPLLYDAVYGLRPAWLRRPTVGARLGSIAVYVDSMFQTGGTAVLRTLPVDSVLWIQYSPPPAARRRFGVGLGTSALHVSTRLPQAAVQDVVEEVPSFANRPTVRVGYYAPRRLGQRQTGSGSQESRGGLSLSYSQPLRHDVALVLGAQHGRVRLPVLGGREGALSSLGLGLKYLGAAGADVVPSIQFALSGVQMHWSESETGGRPAETLTGWSPRGEVGVDVRILERVGLFGASSIEMYMLPDNIAESWLSFTLGASIAVGR